MVRAYWASYSASLCKIEHRWRDYCAILHTVEKNSGREDREAEREVLESQK
jgi:hypothetical protein